jgi:putative ABC transport system permease protein
MIMPGSSSSGAVMFGSGSIQTLSPQDATSIARECPSAHAVAIIIRTRAQVIYGDQNWAPATVQGCSPSYLEVRDWPVVEGENFTDADVRNAAQVCLVGQTVVDNLFQSESPVGKRVRLKGLPFRVIGVLDRKGASTFGSDQDDVLLLPWTTTKKKLQGSTFNTVDQILVTAPTANALAPLESEIRSTLRANHHLQREKGPEAMDDFTIRNMAELLSAMTATTTVMTSLLAAIASVSLLVGGIGIMNIMLVSVTERTREIGLRMAVGAGARDVLSQFLVEAVVLSGLGGMIGIALGSGGAIAASHFAHWPSIVSIEAIVLAVVFSGAVGVIFGFYPAWRASRLDPIEALRYE